MIPVRNYVPQIKVNEKPKDDEEDNTNHTIIKKNSSLLKFDAINKKDIIFHKEHGLLRVMEIELAEDGQKKHLECYAFENGKKNKEKQHLITQEDVMDLVQNIKVLAKIHLRNGEEIVQELTVAVNSKDQIKELTQPFSTITNTAFNVYIGGDFVEQKTRAMNVIKDGSKLLLYPIGEGGTARPEGPRKFLRFPTHHFAEEYYVGSNDGSICYMPTEDVFIIGFAFYRHFYDYITNIQMRTTYRIKDSSDTNVLQEVTLQTFYIEFSEQQIDENKIIWYDITTQGVQPIKVLAGQNFHLSQSYYHTTTGERFFSGRSGDKFADVDNEDQGVWVVKPTQYYSYNTTLDQGLLPGLLFKFA